MVENIESGVNMIYALLATISSINPTATTVPTATTIPIPTVSPVIDAIGVWEKADVIGSISLGFVALVISVIALIITLSQQRKEEDMRKREAKIAVIDKAFEVYNFFTKELAEYNIFSDKDEDAVFKFAKRKLEILYLTKMIFKDKALIEMNKIMQCITDIEDYVFVCKTYPLEYSDKKYEQIAKKHNLGELKGDACEDITDMRIYQLFSVIGKRINSVFEDYRLNL